MSTSHYSQGPHPAPKPAPKNTRRHTLLYSGAFWALAAVDILALIGSADLVDSLCFAGLALINALVLVRIK
jgi:hypothetical protein